LAQATWAQGRQGSSAGRYPLLANFGLSSGPCHFEATLANMMAVMPAREKREERRTGRARAIRRVLPGTVLAAAGVAAFLCRRSPSHLAESVASVQPQDSSSAAVDPSGRKRQLRFGFSSPFEGMWRTCAVAGGTCRCTGTLVFSTLLGEPVREVNSDGDVQCTAEALGAPMHFDPRVCWCQDGIAWGDDVRKGLASLVRQGLTPRIEISTDESEEPTCDATSDGLWAGCVTMSRRWDTTVVPQVMQRAAPAEEQLDMSLRKLDACHRMAPHTSLRVLGVRPGQAGDSVSLPVSTASVCSVVYRPSEGALWTAAIPALYCAASPGTCTTTPCECRRNTDRKLELHTPEGRQCWACAEPGKEYQFRINALAEQMGGTSVSWWPPSGINCPPILWMFMDWRAVMSDCPVIFGYMCLLFGCLMVRKIEELSGGLIPWTRVTPLFGPTLKRGEIWRFFTFTFVHLQFLDLFHNLLTLLDALDVEGTPAIVLGDGSNLKCGVGAKQNFMCYPSIGLGSAHTLGVAVLSAMVGGMCSTWMGFKAVFTGASALGFGLSGAIVALYALYAGAELDQTTSVQRSFQDWVWLRLIFVGFHIAMEFIRGFSQKDVAGLFSHTAAFGAGFGYVLYFLPPMGDGSLLPSDRPYVVPCAYDTSEGLVADHYAPQCVRLFSQLYEYQVPVVQHNAWLMFITIIGFTVLNTVVLQRKTSSSEAALLAGMEVSAVCCTKKPQAAPGGRQPSWQGSNLEGKDIIFWCDVIDVSKLQLPAGGATWKPRLEVRLLGQDPRKASDALLAAEAQAAGRTREMEGAETLDVRESLFLPTKFSKATFVQLVLRNASPEASEAAVGVASIPLHQALRFNRRDFNEQRLKLSAVGAGSSVGAGRAVAHVVFRCLEVEELQRLQRRITKELDDRRFELQHYQREVDALKAIAAASETAADGGNGGAEGADRP